MIYVHQLSMHPRTIARILGGAALILVVASIAGNFSTLVLGHSHLKGLVPLFNLDREHNIPTFFSMLLLLTSALLLSGIAIINGKQRLPHVSKWAILSFGFLFMSYDEIFAVHEKLIMPLRTLLGDSNLDIFYFAWVIPGIAVVFVLGLFFYKFLLYLPAKTRLRFLISATLYIGGAIGMEMIGGRYGLLHGEKNWTYAMIVTVEESLEMAGLIFFIYALLKYGAESYKEVHFKFDNFENSGIPGHSRDPKLNLQAVPSFGKDGVR
jgi:hypothetical protein